MNSQPEGPNPLRPYYIPPSIGLSSDQATSQAASSASASAATGNITTLGNSARDILSDFDYSEYLGESSPSVLDSAKQLLESATWKYSRVLMSQPFEVAKTILQVYVVQDTDEEAQVSEQRGQQDPSHRKTYYEDDYSSQSSDDENSYFSPSAPAVPSTPSSRTRRPPPRITDRSGYIPQTSTPSYTLKIKGSSSLLDVLSQLWSTSGPTSIWKASNSTFIYSIMLPTLNTFIRSLLSAIVGSPEDSFSSLPGSDILTSPSPGTALILSCLSSALSSIILSPIDTARTYLILSPQAHGPRSLLRSIRLLPKPNYLISPHLLPITIMTSTLPSLLASSTPLFLRSYLSLDPVINPSSWSIFTLMASGLELGLRIPLETVLRRAQIATFTSPVLRQQSIAPTLPAATHSTSIASPSKQTTPPEIDSSSPMNTIVPTPQTYRGIVGTMWNVVYEEGTNTSPLESETIEQMLGHPPQTSNAARKRMQRRRKGQGIRGLYRSWRLEMWGVVGIWGSGFLGALLGAGDDDVVSDSVGRMALGVPDSRIGSGTGAF